MEITGKRLGILQGLQIGEELELAWLMGLFELFEKPAAEQPRQHAYGKKEAGAASDPALVIGRYSAALKRTPGITQWIGGWCSKFCPQRAKAKVCSTPKKPISAPRCLGSRAMVSKVWAVARKRIPYTTALFWNALAAICSGTVKTRWKYSTGNNSALRALKRMLEPLGPRQGLAFRAVAVTAGIVRNARKFALFDVAAQGRRPAGLEGVHQFDQELMQR
jgi:hypothetical protein